MVKERKILRNGDIVEFPVPYEKIFGYAKFVDLDIGNPNNSYYNPYRWFVINYFSETRRSDIDLLKEDQLLCNPLLMYWTKSINKLEGWRIIRNDVVTEWEYKNRFLRSIPNSFFTMDPKFYQEIQWSCCLEPNDSYNHPGNWVEYPYENIRHLEGSGSSPVINLPIRAFLEKCKLLNIEFDVTKLTKAEWYGGYLQCLDKPSYNLIPIEYRQKPIPKEIQWNWPSSSKLYFNYYDRKQPVE
jgi:hypothetical protein